MAIHACLAFHRGIQEMASQAVQSAGDRCLANAPCQALVMACQLFQNAKLEKPSQGQRAKSGVWALQPTIEEGNNTTESSLSSVIESSTFLLRSHFG